MFSLICLILMLTASLSFDSTEWDFGKVDSESGTLFHNFRITNDSDEDFRLAGVVCSCSCVKAYDSPRRRIRLCRRHQGRL